MNLSEINTQITTAIIENAFLQKFQQQITYLPDNLSHPLIAKEQKTLRAWQWRFGKTLPFGRCFTFNNTSFSLEVKNGQLVKLHTDDQNHYVKLTHWIKEVTPYYTKSSFNKAPLHFTTQEKALLTYLYEHTEEVTEGSECNDHSIMG
jgi:desulfoferrodoxin (superoxide reductase-like protein)